MTVTINKKATVQDRFKIFLGLVGTFQGIRISDKEIDILNEFYWRSGGVISKESRKEVMEELGMTDYNLNNYIMKLRKKGLLDGDSITEKLILHVAPSERSFGILFVLES